MDLMSLIKQKRQTLITIFLILIIIGFIFLLSQNFKYGSKSKVLVIQEGSGRVDPFSVSRSVEYLSDLLSRVVYSYSFFEEVMDSDFNIDKKYFSGSSNKKMKLWRETLAAKSLDDSGIININVYHEDPYQALQIALAVNHVLINSHQNYHGLGSSVKISVIDQPSTSPYPVKPNLIYSFMIIFSLSLVFALLYVYLFPETKYDINLFGEKKKNSVSKISEKRDSQQEFNKVDSRSESSNYSEQKNRELNKKNYSRVNFSEKKEEIKSFLPHKDLIEKVMEGKGEESSFSNNYREEKRDPLKIIDEIIESETVQEGGLPKNKISAKNKGQSFPADYEEIKKSADINSLFYED